MKEDLDDFPDRESFGPDAQRGRSRIGGEEITVLRPSVRPATVTSGFIGLLLTTVAALVIWPFSRPLLWFLFLLMAVFFLFAFAVISLSILVIFQAIRASLSPECGGSSSQKPGRSVPGIGAGTAGQTSDLWDRWLDGA